MYRIHSTLLVITSSSRTHPQSKQLQNLDKMKLNGRGLSIIVEDGTEMGGNVMLFVLSLVQGIRPLCVTLSTTAIASTDPC